MATIARGTKAGGGTNLNSGQTIDPAEVNTDINTAYTEINGALDDANIETATIPGGKSLRFTEISAPSSPASNDVVLYAVDRDTTTSLEYKDSAGLVVSLGREGARVYNSANISIPNATLTDLTFDTERFDRGGFHSTVSNTGRLTIPHAGTYYVGGSIGLTAGTDYSEAFLYIRLNAGAIIIGANGFTPTTGNVLPRITVSTLWSFAASDYVVLTAYHQNGASAARNCLFVASYSPEFYIYCLGG
mgnify:CR=1 FL=1